MTTIEKHRDQEAKEFVREGGAEVMDTYQAHEDTFKAGWDKCMAFLQAKGNEEFDKESVEDANENHPIDEINNKFFSPFKGMVEMYALQKGVEKGFELGARWQHSQSCAHIAALKEKIITREKLKSAFDKCFDGYDDHFNDICKELGL